jgi:WD40 repeat protein
MSAVFSLDAQTLISGSADGTIRIWYLATGEQLGVLTNDSAGSVMSVAISPDGQLIAGGGADSTVKIWQRD